MATKKPKAKTKRPARKAELSKEQERFLTEYYKCKGNRSKAARRAVVGVQTTRDWQANNEAFARAFQDTEEAILDDARECWNKAAEFDWKASKELLEKAERKQTIAEGAPITIQATRGEDRPSARQSKKAGVVDGTNG